jgi:hypothetical protein
MVISPGAGRVEDQAMKALLAIVLAAAGLWVWTHHTAGDSSFCLTAPEQVCIQHVTTTVARPAV